MVRTLKEVDGLEAVEAENNSHGRGESPIQAIRRAVAILGLFTDARSSLTLSDLMRGSGLGKSTTHRYAMSLRKEGLLRYDPESALYSLGAALIRMGRLAEEGLQITEAAGPHMEHLAAETNVTIALAIPDAGAAVVVKVVYPPRAGVFVGVKVGSRQASRSAQALAMRAAEQRGVSRDQEVAEVQRQGYAIVDYPQIGISAVACAIVHGGDLLATMAAVGTTTTISGKIEPIAQGLRSAARRIAEYLGELRA